MLARISDPERSENKRFIPKHPGGGEGGRGYHSVNAFACQLYTSRPDALNALRPAERRRINTLASIIKKEK